MDLPKIIQAKDGRYGVNVKDHLGKPKRVWFGRSIDEAEAQRRYRMLLADLSIDNHLPDGWEPPWIASAWRARNAKPYTWEAMLEICAEEMRNPKYPKVVLSAVLASEPHLPKKVSATTPAMLRAMMRAWDGEYAKATQQRYMQVVVKGLDKAQEMEMLTAEAVLQLKSALKPISRKKPRKHVDQMADPESVRAVIPALAIQWRDAATMMLLTGARPSELFTSRISDLDKDAAGNHWIVPIDHKTAHHEKDRRIPLIGTAWEIIEARIEGRDADELIFVNEKGQQLTHYGFTGALKRKCAKFKVKPFSCYQLRHLAITRAIHEEGLLEASRLAGHANPQVTAQVYAHALDKEAIAGAEALANIYKEDIPRKFEKLEDVLEAFEGIFGKPALEADEVPHPTKPEYFSNNDG